MKKPSKRNRRHDARFVREMEQLGFDPRQAEILLEIKLKQATHEL